MALLGSVSKEKYGLFTGTVYIIPHMIALLKATSSKKKARNLADIALAHIFAPEEEFAPKFFNMRGKKQVTMVKPEQIGHQYRTAYAPLTILLP